MDAKIVGERLKAIFKAKGLRQRELSAQKAALHIPYGLFSTFHKTECLLVPFGMGLPVVG